MAEEALLTNGALLTTDSFGAGRAGDLRLTGGSVHLDNAGLRSGHFASGDGGNVMVNVRRLTLTGGAAIETSTERTGRGGALSVVASDAISIAGRDRDGVVSGLFSSTSSSGEAGRITLATPTLTMDNGLIEASAQRGSGGNAGSIEMQVGRLMLTGGAQILGSTEGPGRGGEVTVVASDTIALTGRDSGLFTQSAGRGTGGNLNVAATHIQLSDGGTISALSTGEGAAGTIQIQAGETFQSQNGRVTTESARAGGGAIALRAGRLVRLRDSELTTTVQGGGGDAGNLTIDSRFLVAENSKIMANAFAGQGGNVRIGAEVFLADPASLVSASSTLGIQGTVEIQAPVTSLSGTLAPLPQAVVSVAELLPARCAARVQGGKTSSLVQGGPEGLPYEPGGVLPSPLERREPPASGEDHGRDSRRARLGEAWSGPGIAPAALDLGCGQEPRAKNDTRKQVGTVRKAAGGTEISTAITP